MSLQADTIEEAWLKLKIADTDHEFPVSTVRLPVDFGYGPVRVGIGADGAPQLLVPTASGRRLGDGLSGRAVRVAMVQYVVNGRKTDFIEVRSTEQHLEDVFHRLVDEILRRLVGGSSPEQAVSGAIAELRDLLRRASPRDEDFLVGLYGELTFLLSLVERNPAAAKTWTGPLLQRHDFSSVSICAEVKTSLRRGASAIKVSSLEQFDPPTDGRSLILVYYTIERTGAGGQSIRDLIESCYQHVDGPLALDAALGAIRLHDWRSDPVLVADRFGVLRRQYYRVEDDFPRLSSGSFVGGGPPTGVSHISYELDLSHAQQFRVAEGDVEALIERVARAE